MGRYDVLGNCCVIAAIGFIIVKGTYYPLSYLLNLKLNTKSHGKAVDFWAGYKKVEVTPSQKWYRVSFWSIAISSIIGWDAFLYNYFFIPSNEMSGATWHPVIAGFEIPYNFNYVLLTMLWVTSILFIYISKFAATYLSKPHFTYILGSLKGVGTIKNAKDLRRLEQNNVLNELIERKLLLRRGRINTATADKRKKGHH